MIREKIKTGDIKSANELLTRPYFIKGKVVHGKARGKKLGFPTANIEINENYLIAKDGVYTTIIEFGQKKYLSMTSIGFNPTFNGNRITIESHILDFNEDIYNTEVKLYFLQRLRSNIKFNKIQSLIDQMKKDLIETKKIGKLYKF